MHTSSKSAIFYGAAIQGAVNRGERADIHNQLMDCIEEQGYQLVFDHTRSRTKEENKALLDKAFADAPNDGIERRRYVRNKMIKGIEGEIAGAIFEVSTPSLGTGVEIAHAYLRPKMGLREIPILLLYQTDFWPHNLSTMIRGLPPEEYPNVHMKEYKDIQEALQITKYFLNSSSQPLV